MGLLLSGAVVVVDDLGRLIGEGTGGRSGAVGNRGSSRWNDGNGCVRCRREGGSCSRGRRAGMSREYVMGGRTAMSGKGMRGSKNATASCIAQLWRGRHKVR